MINIATIDVEDWFHILDCPGLPQFSEWERLESKLVTNTTRLLDIFEKEGQKVTMFWLGWAAQKHPDLVMRCHAGGHEIASHGYAHVLAYEAGRKVFREDIRKGKQVLEDIIGESVKGFRSAGFSITAEIPWAFDEIASAGFLYDSSVFPGPRGHGGMQSSEAAPHLLDTDAGPLVEVPQSMITIAGRRVSLFGGGYLRLAPAWLIKWGIRKLEEAGRPFILYIHPREIDPLQPRLPLPWVRSFKSYVNLESTARKLQTLAKDYRFTRMDEYAKSILT